MENDVTTGCAEREPEPALDIRIVSLYSSSINHMNQEPMAQTAEIHGTLMAHYNQIAIRSVKCRRDNGSPLAQAYQAILSRRESIEKEGEEPQQEIMAFADLSENDLSKARVETFWENAGEPLLFMTLVSIGRGAVLKKVRERIQAIFFKEFSLQVLVYDTFDSNDLVIFYKGRDFKTYAHAVLKLDYTGQESNARISDSITLYSFLEGVSDHIFTTETFGAYLRMGVANTDIMEQFHRKMMALEPQTEANYILGRHDIGFYQPNATLKWLYEVRNKIEETTREAMEEMKCHSVGQEIKSIEEPVWYTTSTLSLQIRPATEFSTYKGFAWHDYIPEPRLREQMAKSYQDFKTSYQEICAKTQVIDNKIWLRWLRDGSNQAISFLESDWMQEMGICLVPQYLEFLHYANQLWDSMVKHADIMSKDKLNTCREEAERSFMELFQNILILTDSMNHSARQVIQTPSFRTVAFSMPPKIMAYYMAVTHQLIEALCDDRENSYDFMIAPKFTRDLEVVSLAQKELTDNGQMLSIAIGEQSLYTLQKTTSTLAHEISHYVGKENRSRKERKECILQAAIQNFLYSVLDVFYGKLDMRMKQLGWNSSPKMCPDLWEQVQREAEKILMESTWLYKNEKNSEWYLYEVAHLAECLMNRMDSDPELAQEGYRFCWDTVQNKDDIYAAEGSCFGEIDLNESLRQFIVRKLYTIYLESVDLVLREQRKGKRAEIQMISDLFSETFADLQAACTLGLTPQEYIELFCERGGDIWQVSSLEQARVWAVKYVLAGEKQDLKEKEKELQQLHINKIVEYYVCKYLSICKEKIDMNFARADRNEKIQSIQILYRKLGDDSNVQDLMTTLRRCMQDYRKSIFTA